MEQEDFPVVSTNQNYPTAYCIQMQPGVIAPCVYSWID